VQLSVARGREHPRAAGADAPAAAADAWDARASALVAGRGWCTTDDPLVGRLADQLRAADAAGIDLSEEHLSRLAEAADRVADADIASVPGDPAPAVRQVVVGTLLTDPVLLTLRRLAQQRASGQSEAGAAAEGDSPRDQA